MIVRAAGLQDARQINEIYNHYIRTSYATFELDRIELSETEMRLRETLGLGFPFLAAEVNGGIEGFAYGRPFRPRPGYRFVAEVAVYVKQGSERRGIGHALYEELIRRLFASGFHSLIAAISLPNDASIRLHEKFGFKRSGHFREVGRKFDRWIDVGYWQLLREND